MREIEELLHAPAPESGTTVTRSADELGFAWVVIEDPDVDDLATTIHMVSRSLEERGLSERLLCAVFGFDGEDGPVDLVYAYKRGTFYPFAPREGRRARQRPGAAAAGHARSATCRWSPSWSAGTPSGTLP